MTVSASYIPSDDSTYRKRAKKVYGELKECERCGTDEKLQIHHKDRNPKNNERDNLECLCNDCHADEHGGNFDFVKKGWVSGCQSI